LPNISGACDFSGPAGAGDGWGKRRAAEAHTTAAGAGVWVGSEVVCAGAAAGVSTHGPRPLARDVHTATGRAGERAAGRALVRLRRCYAAWHAARERNQTLQPVTRRAMSA
jgi:hypothetical protein